MKNQRAGASTGGSKSRGRETLGKMKYEAKMADRHGGQDSAKLAAGPKTKPRRQHHYFAANVLGLETRLRLLPNFGFRSQDSDR